MGKRKYESLSVHEIKYDRSVAYEQIFGYGRIVDGREFIGDRDSAKKAIEWLDRKGFIELKSKWDGEKRVKYYDVTMVAPVY